MITRIQELAKNPLIKRIVHGGLWSVIGEIGARLFPFLAAILIARFLGVQDFGEFAMIQSTAGAFSVIGGFGLGSTATKYVAEYRFNNPEKANSVITLTLIFAGLTGIIATLGLALSSPLVALKVLANPELSIPLIWAAPMLLFTAIYGAVGGIFLGFEKTRAIAKLSAISSVVISVFTIIGIYQAGVLGGAIAMSVGSFIQMLLGLVMLKEQLAEKGLRIYTKNSLKERNLIWSFSLPSTLATMMHMPIVWLAQAIVANQPSGYAELGLYNAAIKWQTLVTFLPMAFSVIYLPVFSSINAEKNYTKFLSATNKLAIANILSVLPVALIVFLMADNAMSIFGKEFVSGDKILSFILFISVLSVVNRVYWQALISLGKVWFVFWITLFNGLLALILTWLFKSNGGLALVYSMSIAGIINFLLYYFYLNSRERFSDIYKDKL